ncbi:MAG: tRNA epoxyqueuosine(34) reductase QueG [Pseudomonadales bacterium]
MDYQQLRQDILGWGKELGFQQLGITDMDVSAEAPRLRAWLARGFQGDMGYLERNLDKRLQPESLVPGTCRVISARMDYFDSDSQPLRILEDASLAYVSRYTLGRDYHKVVRRRLAQLGRRIDAAAQDIDHRYRAFTDSAPVLEKALAARAGLGWIGKHTLLLNRSAGSWFFLGELYTNLPLPVDTPAGDGGEPEDHCGACKACMTVCPTDAIIAPRQLDARRCISYLTIEHRGVIPEALRAAMGNRIFGCDDCQLYCPWNRFAADTTETDFRPRVGAGALAGADLLSLFRWSESEFLQHTEGSAIRRISYEQWSRNLAIALGNGPVSEAAIALLHARRVDASALLAEHIDWAIARLSGGSGTANHQSDPSRVS